MKFVRPTFALVIWLALMSNGCGSLSPSAAYYPTWQQENQESVAKAAAPKNDTGWDLVWLAFYIGGEILASR